MATTIMAMMVPVAVAGDKRRHQRRVGGGVIVVAPAALHSSRAPPPRRPLVSNWTAPATKGNKHAARRVNPSRHKTNLRHLTNNKG